MRLGAVTLLSKRFDEGANERNTPGPVSYIVLEAVADTVGFAAVTASLSKTLSVIGRRQRTKIMGLKLPSYGESVY